MKCLIFGGAGDIGSPVTERLMQQVLGRRAISFERWAEENADAYQ